MKGLFVIISTFFTMLVSAQTSFNFQWVRHTPTTRYANDMCTDEKGHLYVAGGFGGTAVFGNDTLVSKGMYDIFLVKYDQSGNVLWAKSAGGDFDDLAYGVAVSTTGNIYFTGYIRQSSQPIVFGNDTLHSNWMNTFLAKFDQFGNPVFAKASNSDDDAGYEITLDSKENIYITGHCTSEFSIDNLSLSNNGNIFVCKLNSAGQPVWGIKTGNNYSNLPRDIICDQNNNVLVTGNYRGSVTWGSLTFNSLGVWDDIFLTKLDANGNVLWAKSYGDQNYNWAGGIACDNQNSVYLSGSFSGPNFNFGQYAANNSNPGTDDMLLAKLDASGNEQWVKTAGGSKWDGATKIACDKSGNVYVTGCFESSPASFGAFTFTNNCLGYNGVDIFVAKYNSNGIPLNVVSVGGSDHDELGQSIAIDRYDNIYTAGCFRSSQIVFGNDTINNPNYWQMYVTKLTQSVVTGLEKKNKLGAYLYPNPCKDFIYVESPGTAPKSLKLFDTVGRCILRKNYSSEQVAIDVSVFPKGIYIVEIISDSLHLYEKVIVD